jgi:hypothetical protein
MLQLSNKLSSFISLSAKKYFIGINTKLNKFEFQTRNKGNSDAMNFQFKEKKIGSISELKGFGNCLLVIPKREFRLFDKKAREEKEKQKQEKQFKDELEALCKIEDFTLYEYQKRIQVYPKYSSLFLFLIQ